MSNYVLPLAALGALVKSREPFADVRVDQAVSGKEARSTWQTQPRYRYTVGLDVLRSDAGSRQDWQQYLSHFVRHFGNLDSFLMQDPDDCSVTNHGFGVGDGTTKDFQLQRTLAGGIYDALGGPYVAQTKPRTNLIYYSNDPIGGGVFTGTGSGVASPSTSTNRVMCPDLTANSLQIDIKAITATNQQSVWAAPFTLATAGVYTFSVWAKSTGGLGGTTTYLSLTQSGGIGYVGTTMNLTSQWQRFSVSIGAGAGSAWIAQFGGYTVGSSTQPTSQPHVQMWLWGAQLELLDSAVIGPPTAYIPTAASVVTVTPAYWPGYGDGYEPVCYPAADYHVYVAGTEITPGFGLTANPLGMVHLVTAPSAGAVLTWTGTYLRRVRLDAAAMPLSRMGSGYWSGDLKLVSVLP